MIYVGGHGLPGKEDVVYAEWTQEQLEPNDPRNVPEAARVNAAKVCALLVDSPIEFYELVTPDKLKSRGLS